jgi:class 3 adenylate cyclase/tetratricopeptide (TPR) repeat protein
MGADTRNKTTIGQNKDPVPLDRRTVTVLFADIVQSTRLIAGMDPEAGARSLDPLLHAFRTAVEQYGGVITKHMGDGIMAVFGVPITQEDHPVRACYAALAIQREVERLNSLSSAPSGELMKVRVGLNSGLVVVTTRTDGSHVEYDTLGPAVNLASRLENVAEPGTTLISEETYRRARHLFDCRYLGSQSLKGFSVRQHAYQLLGQTSEPQDIPGALLGATSIGTSLVGRADQLLVLQKRLDDLATGRGSIILITGEPGVGKSRLLHEAKARMKAGLSWHSGHALSFGQRLSYWPFIELLKPWLGIHGEAESDRNWQLVEQSVQELMGESGAEILPYVGTLLGIALPESLTNRLHLLDPENLGGQIMRAMWRLFEAMARRGPIAIMIEDLHWLDQSSTSLILHLMPLANTVPIAFFLTSRSDGDPVLRIREFAREKLKDYFVEIGLQPLSVQDSQELIIKLVGDEPKTKEIRDLILYRAEGNPFFAEEIVRTLFETKVIVRDPVSGGSIVSQHEISLPDTIKGVVMARIDRLDDHLRHVLGVASVIGRTFLYRVLRVVVEQEPHLDDELLRLKAIEIIDELQSGSELAYLFHHALAQETVYDSLLIERRKFIHRRVAECLSVIYADRLREVAPLLAFHYARAEDWPNALRFLVDSADQSSRMAADDEALLQYESAVEAYGRVFGDNWDRVQRGTMERRLGEIHLRRANHAQALTHLARALTIFGGTMPESRAAVRLAFVQQLIAQIAHRMLPNFYTKQPRASVDAKPDALLRTFEPLMWTHLMTDHVRVNFLALTWLNLSEQFGLADQVSKSCGAFGYALGGLGWTRIASFYIRRAVTVAEQFQNPEAMGLAWNLKAIHEYRTGQWTDANTSFERSRECADRAGELTTWANASVLRGEMLLDVGRLREVLDISDAMIAIGREASMQTAYRWGISIKGKALRRLGQLDEAERVLEEATTLSFEFEDINSLASSAGDVAFMRLAAGKIEEAEQLLNECNRVMSTRDLRSPAAVFFHNSVAAAGIARFENVGDKDSRNRRSMLRACQRAVKAARILRNGQPAAVRLMGTAYWALGQGNSAEKWWSHSLSAGEGCNAHYQVALTLIERGRRMRDQTDLNRGLELMGSIGSAVPPDVGTPLI